MKYVASLTRFRSGSNIASFPLTPYEPITRPDGPVTRNVAELNVFLSTGSENVTVMNTSDGISVAPEAGLASVIVGAIVSFGPVLLSVLTGSSLQPETKAITVSRALVLTRSLMGPSPFSSRAVFDGTPWWGLAGTTAAIISYLS